EPDGWLLDQILRRRERCARDLVVVVRALDLRHVGCRVSVQDVDAETVELTRCENISRNGLPGRGIKQLRNRVTVVVQALREVAGALEESRHAQTNCVAIVKRRRGGT